MNELKKVELALIKNREQRVSQSSIAVSLALYQHLGSIMWFFLPPSVLLLLFYNCACQ